MKRRPVVPRARSGCPISISLELFGDRWSLLVVRDLLFKGRSSFGEFEEAPEGMATNILADRLKRLGHAGIIARKRDPSDRRSSRYYLTAKGFALAPLLVEMVLWAARYEETEANPATVAFMTTHRARFMDELKARWERKGRF